MAIEHLARHLRIARLVGPDESELRQAVKEKKRTEARNQQHVCAGASGHGDFRL